MIIRDLPRYDLNTIKCCSSARWDEPHRPEPFASPSVSPQRSQWTFVVIEIFFSKVFMGSSSISLHLSTSLISLPFLESILLYFFRFMRLGAIRMWACQACSCRRGAVQRNSYVPVQHQATMPRATNAGHWVILSHMEELEALLAQVQSLTQRMLSLEELRMQSMWPDSTRFRSEPIWQEDKHRSERRMTERPCKGEV